MATAYDVNNFVIDRVLRGVMKSTTDDTILWSVNQITNPSLKCTTETAEAVDMLGTKITTFERAKDAEFTAENSLFDLGLYAAQAGTEKEIASSTQKMVAPAFETIDVTSTSTVTLKNAPVGMINAIYILKGDSTLGTEYKNAAMADAEHFVHTSKSKTITLPTGLIAGTQLFVSYDYETDRAVAVNNTAINFPKAGKFIMEVLGCDVCDSTKLIHAYLEFPNAKLLGDVDMSFTTDGTHPFTIKCQQEYCDKEKKLYRIVIPDEE